MCFLIPVALIAEPSPARSRIGVSNARHAWDQDTMPHPEYERAELVHLCTVITRSNRPPSHAESAGICTVGYPGSLRRRSTALQTATVTAGRRIAVRLQGRTGGARQMLAEMGTTALLRGVTGCPGVNCTDERTRGQLRTGPWLFNTSLRRAGPACHRQSVCGAECQLSTPRTTVN